ncbi:PilZ domain-containing protein [Erythrobacter sp. W53]|uniref:PilZ domain-containing protein n=1 Tax=Erythrobacter sp. W53 TaxID=3425947 RepID=UPI003D767C9A
MHEIRKALSNGSVPSLDRLLVEKEKAAPDNQESGLGSVTIARKETRKSHQRHEDRYPLRSEVVEAKWREIAEAAKVINFSSNGVQIETDQPAKIAEIISVKFDDCEPVDCAVRWIRGERLGLEFLAETQILADAGVVDYVVTNIKQVLDACGELVSGRVGQERRIASERHGLIWLAGLSKDGEQRTARLRNISEAGALLSFDDELELDQGDEVSLNFEGIANVAADVVWQHSNKLGLRFRSKFDIAQLIHHRATGVELLVEEQTENLDADGRVGRAMRNYSTPDAFQSAETAAARLTLDEVYATLYPDGRPSQGTTPEETMEP